MIVLSDLLQNALARYGDATAIIAGDRVLTYRDLDRQASALAGFLASNGVTPGSRVALHLRNCPEYVIADLAILKLAAVKVPLNELMAPGELGYCLNHAGAAAVIAHATLPEPPDGPPSLLRISVPDDAPPRPDWIPWREALSGVPMGADAPRAAPDDVALIAYTGGTTGHPKGVQHSQHRLALNLLAHVICGDVRADEVMLLTTPLPHSAGYHLQACLLQGGTVVLAPRFEAAGFVELVSRHSVTWTFAVPTMLYRLFDQLAAGQAAPGSLRTIVYGAAPMSEARLKEGLDRFGPIFIQLYGQTECPNYIASLSKADHLDVDLLGSCGRSVPFLRIRIVDGQGREVDAGAVGEVEVASPYLLMEYYKNADATAQQIKDGWLRTGDLGYLNRGGYLFLVDRSKDMIISGGMNVYSAEVEAALRKHHAISDVAVVGRPDTDWGEAVIAFVVAEPGTSEEELRRFSKRVLSAYKVPKQIKLVDRLPLTTYGKIDKKALRAELAIHD